MSNMQIADMTEEEYRSAILRIVASGRTHSAIKDLFCELERRDSLFYAEYDKMRASSKAIWKIATSSQTPTQKIKGIRPLVEPINDRKE